MTDKKPPAYDAFVFFSAGPVGDQAIAVDYANRFFESTGKPSFIVSKHPNPFLSDLLTPYTDRITEIKAKGSQGIRSLIKLTIQSIFYRYCYVLILPIALPLYLRIFLSLIRFCTRSRVVGINSLSGFSSPSGPVESAAFLGEKNYIPAHATTSSFADQAAALLKFLGYEEITRPPVLTFIPHPEFLKAHHLAPNEYLLFHLTPSHAYRSLPADRWNEVIQMLREQLPDTTFVFSGSPNDRTFIDECLAGISRTSMVDLVVRTSMQELLTLYANARLALSVHTGNSMIMCMLHMPMVIVNMKGPFMYNYFFNENATILTSKKDCTCDPLDVKCTEVMHKGKPYMACVFNTTNEEIVSMVVNRYNQTHL